MNAEPDAVVYCPECGARTTVGASRYRGVIRNHNERNHDGWHVARLDRALLPDADPDDAAAD